MSTEDGGRAFGQEYIGRPTGAAQVVIERGPVMKFAEAIANDDPVYRDPDAARAAGFVDIPVPPIYAFSAAQYWGAFPERQPPDPTGGSSPLAEIMGELMAGGGMILHGEQEFVYHRPVVVGDVLTSEGRVTDVYAKTSSSGRTMTFIVTEDVYRDPDGVPVLTSRMNLIHRSA